MIEKTTFTVTCLFCGRKISGETITEDGYDWEGHHRGTSSSETRIGKCNCPFGQLLGTMPKIKPMCRNCYYYKNGNCTNPKQIAAIKEQIGNFDVIVKGFLVKNPDIGCERHELDYGIFDDLIKGGQDKNGSGKEL